MAKILVQIDTETQAVVPREPTPEMTKAADDADNRSYVENYGRALNWRDQWELLIDAAPALAQLSVHQGQPFGYATKHAWLDGEGWSRGLMPQAKGAYTTPVYLVPPDAAVLQQALDMLVAAGFVTQAKVDVAMRIAAQLPGANG